MLLYLNAKVIIDVLEILQQGNAEKQVSVGKKKNQQDANCFALGVEADGSECCSYFVSVLLLP